MSHLSSSGHGRANLWRQYFLTGLFVFWALHRASAQLINVCVDFGGFGALVGDQATFLAQVQAYYTGAGLGPDDAQGVVFFNASAPPVGGCQINVTFRCDSSLATVYGSSDKATHTAFVNLYPFVFPAPGKFPDDLPRRVQAIAETMAHEVGHLLCGVHECNGDGLKLVDGSPDPVACSGDPAGLMNTGKCTPCANRGLVPPAEDSRPLSPTSTEQIRMGIVRLAAGGPNWELEAAFDERILRLVEGKGNRDTIPFPGELLHGDDALIDFTYQILSGDETLFEFGWLNRSNQFVEALPAQINPQRLLETRGGAYLHFALRGRDNCPFAGQVFSQKDFGTVTLSGQANPPANALIPGIRGTYFNRAKIEFAVQSLHFIVMLDTGAWGRSNGFYATIPAPVTMTLVPTGAVWKYLDTGSNQGTAWRALNFNDSSWASGPAELGFGDNPVTTINGGPAADRFITTYFRRTFVAPLPICSNLLLRLKRDDGAVVFLNGTEIWRSHMPTGAVDFATQASPPAVNDQEEEAFFEVLLGAPATGLLTPGNNVVAVEVHQNGIASSDLSFDLELVGNVFPENKTPFVFLNFPATGASFQTGQSITLSINDGSVFDPDGTITSVDFFASGVLLGTDTNRSFSFVWTNAQAGSYSLTALASDNSGASTISTNQVEISVVSNLPPNVAITSPANGTVLFPPATFGITATATDPSPGGSIMGVQFFINGSLLGTDMTAPYTAQANDLPLGNYLLTVVAHDNAGMMRTSAPVSVTVITAPIQFTLMPTGSVWRYLDNGTDQGTTWRSPNFNDSSWAQGPAELGFGDNPTTTINGGPATNRIITTYFRAAFSANGPQGLSDLLVRLKRDDGAIGYLNGVEIFRSNMPTGAVNFLTLAPVAVAGNDEEAFFPINVPTNQLRAGFNVLAVEVHQNATNSSDLSFDLELIAQAEAPLPPGTVITDLKVEGTVNGQPLSATGSGTGSFSNGVMTVNWSFNAIPTGYSPFAVLAEGTALGNVLARQDGGALNLQTAAMGVYSIEAITTFPDLAALYTMTHVNCSSNVISSTATITGTVNLTAAIAGVVTGPALWTPVPGSNQIIARVVHYLLRQDGGEPIRADTIATYTLPPGVVPPPLQSKTGGTTILLAAPGGVNPTTARVEYQNSVRPAFALNALLSSPLGSAALVRQTNRLSVVNLGSSGQDGVTIGLDEAEYFNVELIPLSLAGATSSFTVEAAGAFNGLPGTPLGSASLTRTGSLTQVRANFDPVGATLARVEMYSNNVFVGSRTLPTGLLGTIDGTVIIGGCGKLPTGPFRPPFPRPLPCYWIRSPILWNLQTPGQGSLIGNELRILAANATGPIDYLSSFNLKVGNVAGGFSILSQTTVNPAAPPLARFDYAHHVSINGQRGLARGSGRFEPDGVLRFDGIIDRLIPGYWRWPVSWLTLATHSGCPPWSMPVDGGRNLLDLTGGNLGHSILVRTVDQNANLATLLYVRRSGDKVIARLSSQGTANYPEVVGMNSPLVYAQTPNAGAANTGFTETGMKQLVAADGSVIPVSFTANFFHSDPMPAVQQRSTVAQVLSESDDHLRVSMRIQGMVKPSSVATPSQYLVQYSHNYSLNGGSGSATAAGVGHRGNGTLATHAIIGKYVFGYHDWIYSPVTLQLISVVSAIAREVSGAQNVLTLTGGNLGHTVQVLTEDPFARIDSSIRVNRQGDVIVAMIDSIGTADYPPGPASMQMPIELTQIPNPTGGGFTETTVKRLTAADGTLIESHVTASYAGLNLNGPQTRLVNVAVTTQAVDRTTVDLLFNATVAPRIPAPPLGINEWLASADPPLVDYIELYNAGGTAVNLSGYSLTDNLADPRKFIIPGGTVLPAGGYLVYDQNQLGFSLASNGESIGLFNTLTAAVDTVTFGQQSNGVSQGRCPNGSANIVTLPTRSPGAANTCPSSTVVQFQGVIHQPLGNATLQLVSTQLVVGNIGSSGNDGVSVELGAAQFSTVTFEGQNANTLPTGATLTMRAIGTVNGKANSLIGTLRSTDVGGAIEYWCDFSPIGAVAATALVYDGPNLVAQVRDIVGAVARVPGLIPCDIWDPVWPMGGRPWALIDFPSRPLITLTGGTAVNGTRLVTIPQPVLFAEEALGPQPHPWEPSPEPWDPSPIPWALYTAPWGNSLFNEPRPEPWLIGSLSRLEILGQNLGQLHITRTEIGQFHHAHGAVGAARLVADGQSLLLTDIPAGGVNGVDVRLDPVDRFGVRFEPEPSPAIAPPGAFLQASARGSLVGGADQFLGLLDIRKNAAGALAITPNYTAINSARQRVEIVRNGVVVSTTFVSNSVAATVPSWPGGCRKEGPPIIGPVPPILCIWWEWPVNINFTLSGGGGVVSGNQIRVLADNPPVGLSHLSLFSLRAGGGLTNLRLVGEEAGNSGEYFQGLAHLPIGSATLQTVSNQLVIGNLGASGSNGVSLALGDAGFGVVTFDRLDANTLPTGANVHMRAYGTVHGVPNQFLGTLRATDVGSSVQYWCDFSPLGATVATALVYDGPNVVARRDDLVGPVATVPGAILCDPWDPVWPHNPRTIWSIIGFPDRPFITLTGGQPVRGDRLVVIPKIAAGNPDPEPALPTVSAVSRIDILGQNVGTFRIVEEQVGQFHQLNQALGQARLFGVGDDLRLNNLYSSAANPDGVEIALRDADSFSAMWRPLAASPTGSVLRATARGAFGGGAERLLGSAQLTDIGPTKQITADYSPIGAFSRRVEVVRDGVVIATVNGSAGTGVVARVPDWPVGCGKTGPPWRPPILCFWWRWWPQTPFDLGNGRVVIGDELRILAENPAAPLDYLSSFGIQAAGIPEINFVSEHSARSGVEFGGLTQTRLGGAQLSLEGNSALLVSPPVAGATGVYGARIELGAAEFNTIRFDPNDTTLPTGAFLRFTALGELNGVPDQMLAAMKTTDIGAQFALSYDGRPLLASALRVEARLGNTIVASRLFIPPPDPGMNIVTYSPSGCVARPFFPLRPEYLSSLLLATTGPVTILGQPPVIADRIILANVGAQARVGSVSATLIEASNQPDFHIYDQAVGMFGLAHRAAGQARLLGVNGTLRVSNIGSSGEDGVNVELDRADRFSARWFDLDPNGRVPAGSFLEIAANGAFGGFPEQCLGLARVTDIGPTLEITADYSPIGAASRRVEILRSNIVVAVVTGNTGLVARVLRWPDGCGKLAPPIFPPILCIWFDWELPVQFELGPGGAGAGAGPGQTVVGDEIRILAENPPGPLEYLSRFDIHAAGIPEITLISENTGLPVVLSIVRSGNQATVAWTPNVGTLQQADNVTGPWTDVPNATNPMAVSINFARKFYRVRL